MRLASSVFRLFRVSLKLSHELSFGMSEASFLVQIMNAARINVSDGAA